MATATAKKQANTTRNRAKSTARTAKTSAQRTTRSAEATARSAERTARTIVLDSAYATVGLADTAAAFVRTLPVKATERVGEVPTRVPALVRGLSEETPKLVDERLTSLRSRAESEFDTLAGRGRTIIESVQRNTNAQQAREQVRVARKQVAAAAGDIRNAVFAGRFAVSGAVETAADAVSAAGEAAEREQYEAMTVEELRNLAARKDVAGRSDLNKRQLISALLQA